MSFDVQERSACVTCPLRPISFCGTLLDQPEKPQQLSRPRLRQAFGAAGPYQTIHFRGERSDDAYILCHGWAAGVAQLADGRKQILSIMLAGDLCSSKMIFQESLHFSIQALTHIRFSRVNREDVKARLIANPMTLEALGKLCAEEGKTADDLLVDLGRRSAEERIAHLILSLAERIARRSVIREQRYPFPLRQQDIADILGLTSVHVSRVITRFRKANLVEFSGGNLRIVNFSELERIGRPR